MTAIQCQPHRIIRFYGPLAKALGRRSFSAIGLNSASEVMRCLLSNFPQLGAHMRGRHYRVVMNGRAISGNELNDPVGIGHEIHIIPAICGAGGGSPLTTILTGVALIGAGLLFPFASSFLTPLGIGLVLQGVAEMISPTPNDTPESTDPSSRSYNFSGLQQTSREGVPVPLVYGEIITGSIVLSVKIEKDDEKLDGGFTDDIASRPFVFEAQILYQANLYATGCGLFAIPDTSHPIGIRYYEEEWYIPASNQVCLWRWDSGNFDRRELWEAIIEEPTRYKVQILNVINRDLETQLITEGLIQSAAIAQYANDGITLNGISFTHTGNYGPFLNQNNPPGSGNFNGYVSFNFYKR